MMNIALSIGPMPPMTSLQGYGRLRAIIGQAGEPGTLNEGRAACWENVRPTVRPTQTRTDFGAEAHSRVGVVQLIFVSRL